MISKDIIRPYYAPPFDHLIDPAKVHSGGVAATQKGPYSEGPDLPHAFDAGSKERLSVDPRGFEPLTPCMPCRCATGLRHGPRLLRQTSMQLV